MRKKEKQFLDDLKSYCEDKSIKAIDNNEYFVESKTLFKLPFEMSRFDYLDPITKKHFKHDMKKDGYTVEMFYDAQNELIIIKEPFTKRGFTSQ